MNPPFVTAYLHHADSTWHRQKPAAARYQYCAFAAPPSSKDGGAASASDRGCTAWAAAWLGCRGDATLKVPSVTNHSAHHRDMRRSHKAVHAAFHSDHHTDSTAWRFVHHT